MLGEIIADLSNWMYTYLLVILLVAAGLFFTIRNRFPQLPSGWCRKSPRPRGASPPSAH